MAIHRKEPLPVSNAPGALCVTFNLKSSQKDHFAILYPAPDIKEAKAPVVRIHSKCVTGDVFDSLRCDCGPQLAEAKKLIPNVGGAILYMDDEGRGIGLKKKMEAYALQRERGLDTFEANRALGHPFDARDFAPAAEMLKDMGLTKIWLITNNMDKVRALQENGITVENVVVTGTYDNEHNLRYLRAKQDHGHLLSLPPKVNARELLKVIS